MSKENKIYAAYGSNLNLEQMSYRCPYATVAGKATLPGHRLLFRGHSNGAVATVEPDEDGSVPVLLWEITPRDEEELDRYEGWPRLYRKETITVSHNGRLLDVMAYIMNDGYPLGIPGQNYYSTILEGYQSAGFDIKILDAAVQTSSERT